MFLQNGMKKVIFNDPLMTIFKKLKHRLFLGGAFLLTMALKGIILKLLDTNRVFLNNRNSDVSTYPEIRVCGNRRAIGFQRNSLTLFKRTEFRSSIFGCQENNQP